MRESGLRSVCSKRSLVRVRCFRTFYSYTNTVKCDDVQLFATTDPIDLSPVAAAIRGSSCFRFAWRFFNCYLPNLDSAETVRSALSEITCDDELHSFLRDSHAEFDSRQFEIEPLHCHVKIERDGACFLDVITRASLDRIGAYSINRSRSTDEERQPIHQLFSSIGPYSAFYTKPGSEVGCEVCQSRHNDLFTNWYFQFAWDYTFIVTWPASSLIWLGCLTDTD